MPFFIQFFKFFSLIRNTWANPWAWNRLTFTLSPTKPTGTKLTLKIKVNTKKILLINTVCARSLDLYFIVSYYIKWVKPSRHAVWFNEVRVWNYVQIKDWREIFFWFIQCLTGSWRFQISDIQGFLFGWGRGANPRFFYGRGGLSYISHLNTPQYIRKQWIR